VFSLRRTCIDNRVEGIEEEVRIELHAKRREARLRELHTQGRGGALTLAESDRNTRRP
jgi:hypothetical protein